jgi:hypothetical protein
MAVVAAECVCKLASMMMWGYGNEGLMVCSPRRGSCRKESSPAEEPVARMCRDGRRAAEDTDVAHAESAVGSRLETSAEVAAESVLLAACRPSLLP